MKFRPLHDVVLALHGLFLGGVRNDDAACGLCVLFDTTHDVIAVGPGARDESGKLVPLDVKKGDRVLFGKWSGTEVKIDGDDLLIMKERDIWE
jgi:chaperonin GroES